MPWISEAAERKRRREHAAWEAMRSGAVSEIMVEEWRHGKPIKWEASSESAEAHGADPVNAVLGVGLWEPIPTKLYD